MNVNLCKRCRVEFKEISQDATYGTEIITWKLFSVLWCEVQDAMPSRSESINQGLAISANQARWRARHIIGIDSSMRIIIDGIIYQIISGPAEIDNKKYVECMIEKYQ